jgi:CDI immunity proteins
MGNIDLSKTLDELEGVEWGEPTFHSALVIECHRLRKVPLEEFTAENLRIMIGQKMSLEYLVPLAIEKLSNVPFLETDRYKGELLISVLSVSSEFWEHHQKLYWDLAEIMTEIEISKERLDKDIMPSIQKLRRLAQTF